jgi:type IV secretion system protein VirD4
MIAGLIMLIHERKGTLVDLWKYLRLSSKEWITLVASMQANNNEIIRTTGNELEASMESEKMFASIMATAQQKTDFLKSPAMQRSLEKSSFDINALTQGKTTLYVIIPADKLKSHYQWLRLVVSSGIQSVIRKRGERVTFILDEFPSLGPLKEISEFGLAAAAGYNLSFWMILQSLPQLQNLYKDNWQNFIANTAVRQWVGINDNFTAKYVSESIGTRGFLTYNKESGEAQSNTARPVMTPEEVKANTSSSMIVQIEQRPAEVVRKLAYFELETMESRYDANPYFA